MTVAMPLHWLNGRCKFCVSAYKILPINYPYYCTLRVAMMCSLKKPVIWLLNWLLATSCMLSVSCYINPSVMILTLMIWACWYLLSPSLLLAYLICGRYNYNKRNSALMGCWTRGGLCVNCPQPLNWNICLLPHPVLENFTLLPCCRCGLITSY